jgi:cytochrome c553
MRTQIVSGVLFALAALAAPAHAAEAGPDPATQREFNAKLLVCESCHGPNGMAKTPTIPVLTGQREDYLLKQLHDFRSGDRNTEVMKWMSETLTEGEVAYAAAYFAKKNWPARPAAAAAAAPPPSVGVCQACHQENFLGAVQAEGMAAPRLAGQRYDYLVDAMRRFAEGDRKNNVTMMQLMAATSAADREAIARYLSGL